MSPDTTDSFAPSDEDRALQCQTVLAALSAGPMTTPELRALGIAHPAGRVLDLKRRTPPVCIATERAGRWARYRLIEGGAP